MLRITLTESFHAHDGLFCLKREELYDDPHAALDVFLARMKSSGENYAERLVFVCQFFDDGWD